MSSHSIHTQSNSALDEVRFRRMAGWCSHDHFRSSDGHRSGERNCLHRGHHDRVAVMLADKPITSHLAVIMSAAN